ncbi:MAG: DNA/RNA nuclease SfsA [Smithellaceae bacterium]|nr:DNA/RNA nuclease SfsA [Smithellaceae bacterium]
MKNATRSPLPPPNLLEVPLFPHITKGTFLQRPNRFVIHCAVDGAVLEAYLPNPGRLWELLLPGRIVYLVPKPPGGSGRLDYMAVAVEREGIPVLLHTHLSNTVAAALIRAKKIPGLEDATITRAEVRVGHSRFDFLLERGGRPFYLEVKSCTLAGRRIAMFPDAVTLRGKKHLEELAALSRRGTSCGVLFLVHWPQARFFLPDYHTDLEFARSFIAVRKDLLIKAAALTWRSDLSLSPLVRDICLPWDAIAEEARDSGSYLLLLHLPRDLAIRVGSLGEIFFPAGYYLYVGTAKVALSKRLDRHLGKNKAVHWHIDYLRDQADRCTAIPIRSSTPLEHELAEMVGRIADASVPNFGSSDCHCPSHLFRFAENPLHHQSFMDLLQYFRIDRLEKSLPTDPGLGKP